MMKREIGRQNCALHGCTHFMSMDADEYYLVSQLKQAKNFIENQKFDATACRMRTFFKDPIYELLPVDNMNAVPFIYQISENCPFRIAAEYPVLLDPTRRLENTNKFHFV